MNTIDRAISSYLLPPEESPACCEQCGRDGCRLDTASERAAAYLGVGVGALVCDGCSADAEDDAERDALSDAACELARLALRWRRRSAPVRAEVVSQ